MIDVEKIVLRIVIEQSPMLLSIFSSMRMLSSEIPGQLKSTDLWMSVLNPSKVQLKSFNQSLVLASGAENVSQLVSHPLELWLDKFAWQSRPNIQTGFITCHKPRTSRCQEKSSWKKARSSVPKQ